MNGAVITDGHCHVQSMTDLGEVDDILTRQQPTSVAKVVVNGTAPFDWQRVLDLQKDYPGKVLPQLGLHPWRVPNAAVEVVPLLEELRSALSKHPDAGLGECGLDSSKRRVNNYEAQKFAFRKQVELALDFRRPLSVHCVGSPAAVLKELRVVQGRVPVLLHGWSESKEMTSTFAQLDNVYFSVNLTLLNKAARAKAVATVRAIPRDRIILESDAPDGRLNSKEAWVGWFVECHWEGEGHDRPSAEDAAVQAAQRQGTPHNIPLVAHAVAAAWRIHWKDVLAQSAHNIERIFATVSQFQRREI
jgi:TatD DNase family protein